VEAATIQIINGNISRYYGNRLKPVRFITMLLDPSFSKHSRQQVLCSNLQL